MRVAPYVIALLLIPGLPAPAGVPLVDADGVPYRWDLDAEQPNVVAGKVTFFPHASSLRDSVEGQSPPIAAIRLGVREWEIGTTAIRFQEDATRTANGPNGGDRVNWIGWVQSGLDRFVLAVTTVTKDGSVVTDMDVALNDRDFDWDTNTPGVDGIADIQSLVTHEWGHAIGCDHVPLRTSTMHAFTVPGIIAFRSLSPDDRALAGSIYPNSVFAATTGSIAGTADLAASVNDRAIHVVAVSVATGEPAGSTLTSPDGSYRIDGLPAGVYRVVAAPAVPLDSQTRFWQSGSTSFLPSVMTLGGASPGALHPILVAAGKVAAAPAMTVEVRTLPFEPNDTLQQATPIAVGDALAARFESGGDEDWYSFQGVAGRRISVGILSWGLGADADPGLSIVSAATGTVLVQDDVRPAVTQLDQVDGQDLDVRVAGFELPQTGTFWLRLRDQISVGPKSDAFYVLFLTPSSDTPNAALTSVTATPPRVDPHGVSTSLLVVRPRRENGADAGPGHVVRIEHDGAGAFGTVTDRGDGTYAVIVTAPASAGRDRVSVTVTTPEGTATLLDAATLVYLGPADGARSTFTVSPRRIASGEPAAAAVTLVPRDAAGEALGAGRTVAFSLAAPAGGVLSGASDAGDGSYGGVISGTIGRGTGEVSATVDGTALGTKAHVAFGFGLADVLADAIADIQGFFADPALSAKAGKSFAKAESAAAAARDALVAAEPKALERGVAAAQKVTTLVAAGRKKAGVVLDDPGTLRDLALAIREAASDAVAAAVVARPRQQKSLDSARAGLTEGDAQLAVGDAAGAAATWRRAFGAARALRPR